MNLVPLNDLQRNYNRFSDEIEREVVATLRSGWWLNGERTKRFCSEFAAYVGAAHCIALANGTDALELALRVLFERSGRNRAEVITVANAGGYTTTACRLNGLTPVYVDIDERSQLIDLDDAISMLSERTLVVVATHLYGSAVDIPALRKLMDARGFGNLPILEDCSQAHGAAVGKARAGSMGEIATFSFYPTKNLGAAGDGGAVLTSDAEIAEHVRRLHQYGWSAKYTISFVGGRNSRIDEIQAAMLSALLPHLDQMNTERLAILNRYRAAASGGVTFPRPPHGEVGHLAIALVDRREAFRAHLKDRGIATDIHYPILDCDQPAWQAMPAILSPSGLAVSRRSVGRIVTLPCFPGMTEPEIARVADAVATFGAAA